MAEEAKQPKPKQEEAKAEAIADAKPAAAKTEAKAKVNAESKEEKGGRPPHRGGRGQRKDRGKRRPRRQREDDEFDSRIIKVRRVSRMYKGGRRMRLSVVVVIGDRKGHVGIGLGKGADVGDARRKAIQKAKKDLVMIPLKGDTIPHEVDHKFKASKVMLKPAAPGTGLVAGVTVKAVLDLVGVKDVLSKVLNSNNQVNVAYATIEGLKTLRATRL